MTFIEKVQAEIDTKEARERQARVELNECRRLLCDKAAQALRDLGFKDAYAEQEDSGRRDAIATYKGVDFRVGVFWEGDVAMLPPNRTIYSNGWTALSPDLSDLAEKLKPHLW